MSEKSHKLLRGGRGFWGERVLIEMSSIGKGYVSAETKEDAIKKIQNGEYGDIYDEVESECGDIIEITEI